MAVDQALSSKLNIFIGHDSREAIATDVAAHSLRKRTTEKLNITPMKHRELRRSGAFTRPWLVESDTGNWRDLLDNKQFSTEFSHTRFLVPFLMKYRGWALFMDSDMIFLSDVKKLFALADDKFAVMCVKHRHKVNAGDMKMDGRQQLAYHRKNWSSFVLFNCGHVANRDLTPEKVNFMKGTDLHAFSWLKDSEIGDLPPTYNYISGISKKIDHGKMPDVIHYTEGGPWFPQCQEVPYAGSWIEEYEDFQKNGHGAISDVPTIKYESEGKPRTGSISAQEMDELEFKVDA